MPNLKGMSVEALMSLRDQVDKRLLEVRAELEKQLAALTPAKATSIRISSSLKGRKVPPKYRGSSGETWAGRGAWFLLLLWLVVTRKATWQYSSG
jgi:DNA-binding protein H-NS